ncbi:DMT family transporter [Paenibacillus aquistagni]|uniref:Multidrug resistance protein EbrB n=1 Tax=Paenibacillus aquistagni TaxID=1852522 RepID=A0A1X7J9S3_9BACL|nr:multidrug efflux SMR transporter [Paenibacillus aquistagni]SMG23741.1 multidrug resistance protein EbrB [Paenibacillus aquistagni]
MSGAVFLTISIIFEAFGTTMMKLSHGFTVLGPSLGVALGFLVSFTSLSFALKTIPLSIAYATWSGVGTALSVAIGVLAFNESLNLFKIIAIVLIIVGITIMNRAKNDHQASSSLVEANRI